MELSAKDLRIGNYYRLDKSVSIDENVLRLEMSDIRANRNICKLINPIPLTKEWLLKFGFEKSEVTENIHTWSNHSIAINTYSKEKVVFYWLRWYQHPKQSRIKYVHQLQNLYFALTGEELEIKETVNL